MDENQNSGQHSLPPVQQPVVNQQGPQMQTQSMHASVSSPLRADDLDLIEKMWVEKAKNIIRSTSHDPHEQSKQLNSMKAEYIKKRYSRDTQVGS